MALIEWNQENEEGVLERHTLSEETGEETVTPISFDAEGDDEDNEDEDDNNQSDDREREQKESEDAENQSENSGEAEDDLIGDSEDFENTEEYDADGRIQDPNKAQDMAEAEDAGRDAAEIAEQAENAEIAAEAAETADAAAAAVAEIEAGSTAAEGTTAAAATSEVWGPVALGCLIIVIIAAIIFLAIMAFKPDSAGGDTEAGTTSHQTIVCLDAGHGGSDPGATNGSFKESDMNLKIAIELKPKLEAAGYKVIMTRTTDSHVKYSNSDQDSIYRSEYCATSNADIMYRIHLDGSGEPQRTFHILPGPKYSNISSTSIEYGTKIHSGMIQALGSLVVGSAKPLTNGGTVQEGTSSYTRTLKGTVKANELKIPIIWIEALAINNAGINWIKNDSKRASLENAIVAGFKGGVPTSMGSTSNQAIVDAAKAELALGIHEKGCENCGVDRYTMGAHERWCADFASFVVRAAGKPFTGGYNGGWRISAVEQIQSWFEHKNAYFPNNGTNIPQPGDLAIHGTEHINIIIAVKGNQITTIGGNEGDAVQQSTVIWKGSSKITGFGRMP